MQLTPRLKAISELIRPGLVLADIGTDHAYIPTDAVLRGVVPRAIASDINLDPLRAARETIAQYGLSDRIEVRHGPGLDVLQPHEAKSIVIAGMGGSTICGILSVGMNVAAEASRLIVQPMVRVAETREWLTQHGFRIVDERMAKEGRHLYQIIAAEPGLSEPLTESEHDYGPVLLKHRHPLLKELVQRDLAIVESAIAGMKKSTAGHHRLGEFERQRERIIHILSEW